MAAPEQSPHSPPKALSLGRGIILYFIKKKPAAKPVVAPVRISSSSNPVGLDDVPDFVFWVKTRHRKPHDAAARQRNGWPSPNRDGRISPRHVSPQPAQEETCMCVQCGCALPSWDPF